MHLISYIPVYIFYPPQNSDILQRVITLVYVLYDCMKSKYSIQKTFLKI